MLKTSIVALALVAGSTTYAFAGPNDQGGNGSASPGGGAAMEHSQGAAGGSMGGGSSMERGSTGGAIKGRSEGASELRGSKMKGDRSSASDEGRNKADRQQATDEQRNRKNANRQANDNERTGKHEKRAESSDRKDRTGSHQAKDESRREKGATGASEGTEGKAGGPKGSVANITTEQRTRIKSVFESHRVAPAHGLNVAVNVGVVIPRSVHVYPIPEDIVTIVPDYSGYEYFMIDDSHVAIVDPDTLEVVDIIVVA
ncbi:MAG: DUF1236 domain-containing protein [Proteobacteria bacterium]|nr:DUF1236 domain-containing protein [Pseudomonadota bacterium]